VLHRKSLAKGMGKQMSTVHAQIRARRHWLAGRCSPDFSCARLVAAFAVVYFIWGSTYLAIRLAIATIPPLMMAGVRFLIAGTLLYSWMRLHKAPPPARIHWRSAAVVGGLMLMGGNGGVTWSEQRVPSGLAALLIATVPLWMAILEALRRGGTRPTRRITLGLGLGFAGIALLIGPVNLAGGERIDPMGAGVLLFAALSWACGSLYSRRAQLPAAALLGTAMEMLAGGALLLLAGALSGEWQHLDLAAITPASLLALGYLVVMGSLLGFTAYLWLLRNTTPARASTYAYVNPVVAVFLGWALAAEPLTWQTLLAAGVIVAAVVIINTGQARGQQEPPPGQTGSMAAISSPEPG
jgi:drug/metabolite transporter (DMT)-like permease